MMTQRLHPLLLWLCILAVLLSTAPAFSQVTLSEIMYDPLVDEGFGEFVEVFNLSRSDSINLMGWRISDGTASDTIIAAGGGTVLAPGQYGVILDPDYFGRSAVYDTLIPPDALVLKISGSTFGSGGFSNSGAETVSLIDLTGQAVSSYRYSLGNVPGHSDEKIVLEGSNTTENWADSRVLHGTPGKRNSVAAYTFDIAVNAQDITFEPKVPRGGDDVVVRVLIRNPGREPARGVSAQFFEDVNRNSALDIGEEFAGPLFLSEAIAPGVVTPIQTVLPAVKPGLRRVGIQINFQPDENLANNTAIAELKASFSPGSLLLSEIMYRPSAGQPEWVELYNPTAASIDLEQWGFSDVSRKNQVIITSSRFTIDAWQYAIVAEDSAIFAAFPDLPAPVLIPNQGFPALNNDADAAVLTDLTGLVMDSVAYKASWGGGLGISLERVRFDDLPNEARNWGSCVDPSGATPGRKNSISPLDFDLAIRATSIQFMPSRPRSGESVTVSATVVNRGLVAVSGFWVLAFDDANRNSLGDVGEEIAEPVFVSTALATRDSLRAEFRWAGVSAGLHRILIEVRYGDDLNLKDNFAAAELRVSFPPGALVVNEIMFAPRSNEPEWVEFYNPTMEAVDLFEWRLSDSHPTSAVEVAKTTARVPPGSYAVVASNRSVAQLFPDIPLLFVPVGSFPTLNNDSDAVVLRDLTGTVIDSAFYLGAWGKGTGVSLEKIWYERSATDSINWAPSEDARGATPGRMNSVSPMSFDLATAGSLRFDPPRPKRGDEVAIHITLRNAGRKPTESFVMHLFEDANGDSSLTEDEEIQSPLVITERLPSEAIKPVTFHWVPVSSGFHSLFARVDYALDQKPANNLASGRLGVGFPEGTLVINEMMYSPLSGQPEWVELYNRSTAAVDVEAWGITDSDSASFTIITSNSLSIPAGGFVVIAADSSLLNHFGLLKSPLLVPRKKLPSLNNDLDRVALFDLNGNLIDQVVYRASWGGDVGISLERINPELASSDSSNWSSCVFALGGTPGERNSIYTQTVPAKADLEIAPNPFSPDSDGFEDFTIISYQLPLTTAAVNIKIYDVRGRLVRMLFNNEPSGSSRAVVWDGKGDDGQPLRMGIYIVYFEALNARQGVLKTVKKTVVLAGKL